MIVRSDIVLLAILAATPGRAVDTRSADSNRPRGVGPECKEYPMQLKNIFDGLCTLTICTNTLLPKSRQILQAIVVSLRRHLRLPLQSIPLNPVLADQRRLLRLSGWLR